MFPARLQAKGRAKPSQNRPGQARPKLMALRRLWPGLGFGKAKASVRGHQSISLPYLLYSLPLTPTPPCAYVHPLPPLYQYKGRQLSISNSQWPLHIKVVDSRLLPPLAPQLYRTSIGYMGTRPRNTMAPSMSRGLMVRRGLEAWCCIGHYINVLRPSQGSSERSLWIPPD
jgi:hypothetical protein